MLCNISTEKEDYTTCGQNVLCTRVCQDVFSPSPCTHEKADTRMFLHVVDAANRGHCIIMLRAIDTDVLVLAVSSTAFLVHPEVWIRHRRTHAIHTYRYRAGWTEVAILFHRLQKRGRKLQLTYGNLLMKSHTSVRNSTYKAIRIV